MTSMYEQEVRDLLAIIDRLRAFMADLPITELLYVDGMEVTVGQVDGANLQFYVWWDGELECFRVRPATTEVATEVVAVVTA